MQQRVSRIVFACKKQHIPVLCRGFGYLNRVSAEDPKVYFKAQRKLKNGIKCTDMPNDTTKAAIEEGRRLINDSFSSRYSSMEELKAALEV